MITETRKKLIISGPLSLLWYFSHYYNINSTHSVPKKKKTLRKFPDRSTKTPRQSNEAFLEISSLSHIFLGRFFWESQKKKKFLGRLIIVPLADYTGREEVENGKMDESCGCVGSTLFFCPVRIERKKEEMINFHTWLLLHSFPKNKITLTPS